jgi:hypothetical protein
MLRQLQIHRQIIHDLSTSTLAQIPVLFEQLTYLASLRDPGSGHYIHERLAAVYPFDGVQQALAQCHEEIFERVLEIPLAIQEQDLRGCMEAAPGGLRAALKRWQTAEFRDSLLPEEAPVYLKELFGSNLRALLEILREEIPKARSDA